MPSTFTNGWAWVDTVNRTANNKLTKLSCPSRKHSPKRLLVVAEPKKWRGTTKNIFPAQDVPLLHLQIRSGATGLGDHDWTSLEQWWYATEIYHWHCLQDWEDAWFSAKDISPTTSASLLNEFQMRLTIMLSSLLSCLFSCIVWSCWCQSCMWLSRPPLKWPKLSGGT